MKQVPYSDLTSFYTAREDRHAVDLRALGIPECIVLGHSNYRHAYPPLPRHSHFDVAELAYIESGRQPYEIGGKTFILAGGEGIIIPPNTPHSSDGQPSFPGLRYWIQFKVPANASKSSWMRLTPGEAKPLLQMLREPVKLYAQWPNDTALHFKHLFKLAAHPESQVRTAMLRTALLSLLFGLLELQSKNTLLFNQGRIKQTMAWLDEHLAEKISVTELAGQARLPVTSFTRIFKEVAGVTPHYYLLRRRIERARTLLNEGEQSITEIAMTCGFSSSQYFATVFKRIVGVTPSSLLRKQQVPLPTGDDGQ